MHELTDDIPGLKWVSDPRYKNMIDKTETVVFERKSGGKPVRPDRDDAYYAEQRTDTESWVEMAQSMGIDTEAL